MFVDDQALAEAITTSPIPMWEISRFVRVDIEELIYRDALRALPMSVLARLAEVLDLPIARVLRNRHPIDLQNADDAGAVGACLARCRHGLSRDDIAQILEWDLDRIEAALASLDGALVGTGLRVGGEPEWIRLEPSLGSLSASVKLALERVPNPSEHVNLELARTVWCMIFDQVPPWSRDLQETKRTAYRQGLVHHDGRQVQPSDDVAFSLMWPERRSPTTSF